MNPEVYHIHQGFLTTAELLQFQRLVDERAQLFHRVMGRGNLGPKYEVVDGEQIRGEVPELVELWEQRILPLAEQFAGGSIRLMASSRRSMRIQRYTEREDGFRWHFDGHRFAALLPIMNTNQGQTEYLSAGLSRVLRFFLYPLYPFPQLFSLAPRRPIPLLPGDLLLMRGAEILHRGVTLAGDGERLLVVYAFDPADYRPNPLRDRVARWLNY